MQAVTAQKPPPLRCPCYGASMVYSELFQFDQCAAPEIFKNDGFFNDLCGFMEV
jgi:hypothetical protein